MAEGSIVDVSGIRVGHWTDLDAATGCTVVLCDRPVVGGCLIAGAAPGTRETALLDPTCSVDEVHAVLIGGGSAFGLDAAAGVMRYLEERGLGFDARVARVPIVPAAILFDLSIGDYRRRPGPEQGYLACLAAEPGPVEEGNAGAGTGATVGKLFGPRFAMKGGLGTASVTLPSGVTIGAVAAVNCAGDVVDPIDGRIVAGAQEPGRGFLDTDRRLRGEDESSLSLGQSTTIAVIATDARLSKAQVNRLAILAYQGLPRVIRPILAFDGDTVFALSAKDGEQIEDLGRLGAAAGNVLARAVLSGVMAAKGLHGYPAATEVMIR